MPDNMTKMQMLLPIIADLPNDGSTAAFWSAVQSGRTYAAACALLPLLAGEHGHTVYGFISALTGQQITAIMRQPFPVIFKELLHNLDDDMLLFCYIAAAFGIRPVARVLYQYRPPCAKAIPELILMDRDNLKVAVYACDMLLNIVCMFSEGGRGLPTIHDILADSDAQKRKPLTEKDAGAFVDNMLKTFGKKETPTNEQQA